MIILFQELSVYAFPSTCLNANFQINAEKQVWLALFEVV